MKVLSMMAGIGLILFSLAGCMVSLFAIADPVSAKMADDNDPFGPPPSRVSSAVLLAVFASVGVAGVYIIYRSLRKSADPAASLPPSDS